MQRLPFTIALAHYDRHIPLFDGSVSPDGIDLTVLDVGQGKPERHGENRHERMIRDRAFDAAEVSLSSYLMARDQGLALTAIPVFPRRHFTQSLIYCHASSEIASPRELSGRRVGIMSFQTTLSVLAKGELEDEYQVPWREIRWYTSKAETLPFQAQAGVVAEPIPPGRRLADMVARGELDAMIVPYGPRAGFESKSMRLLFSDPKQETARYFAKYGCFPIMHVVAMKAELAQEHPWVPGALTRAFARARVVAGARYDDPNWSQFAWMSHLVAEERTRLGRDLWPTGLPRNRAYLERFVRYSHDQGLIGAPMSIDSLFADDTTTS